jgi:hypothetical protein
VTVQVSSATGIHWRQIIFDFNGTDEDDWESRPPFQQLRMTREGHFDYALDTESILHGDITVVQPTFGHITITGNDARFAYPSNPVLHIFECNLVPV